MRAAVDHQDVAALPLADDGCGFCERCTLWDFIHGEERKRDIVSVRGGGDAVDMHVCTICFFAAQKFRDFFIGCVNGGCAVSLVEKRRIRLKIARKVRLLVVFLQHFV